MNDKKYWIWLSRIKGVNSILLERLLKKYQNPENIWKLNKEQLLEIRGIGKKIANEILSQNNRENLEYFINYMERNDINILTILDEDYPEKLKLIYDKPVILYYKGDKTILKNKSVAIVGCRDCSDYGAETAKRFAYEIAKNNINIISGLARGIDTKAHIGALKANFKTIAVLGNGLDKIYPYENKRLAEVILKMGGLILSEYVIGEKPNKLSFPARNRIISGLSDAIIVVEAKEKSGSLITVDFAIDQGKDVYAVPGQINNKNSVGTNKLIKEGALVLTNINDIII